MRWTTFIAFFIQIQSLLAEESPYPFLNATADTIATATSKLRSGEMELVYNYRSTDFDERTQMQLVGITQLTAQVLWRDDSHYASYNLQESHANLDAKLGAKMAEVGWNGPGEMIQTPKSFCRTVQNNLWCEYKTTDSQTFPHAIYYDVMMPEFTWFSSSPSKGKNSQHITILTMHPGDNRVQTTTVTPVKSNPRRLQIVRAYKEIDFQNGYIVDLDQGGLVVECWLRHPKQDWSGSTWDWKQDAHGVWYVSKWTHTVFNRDDLDSAKIQHEVVVKSFNSQPTIPANRFEFSSIKLAKGTCIEKTTEKGKTISYVGGKPPQRTKFDLDTLIDEAQSGFAAPPEKKP